MTITLECRLEAACPLIQLPIERIQVEHKICFILLYMLYVFHHWVSAINLREKNQHSVFIVVV